MAEIVQFVTRSTLTVQENLDAFVALARDELTAFGKDGAWDGLTWRNDRVSGVFSKYRPRSESRKKPVPLEEPFLTFAKAYFRYDYSHKPRTSMAVPLKAFRMIEQALIEATGRARIQDLSIRVLDRSAHFTKTFQANKTGRYQVGRQIEAIADFCRTQDLVAVLPSWKSPFKKQVDLTETLTEEGVRHRESKMPTNEQMVALADLFARADDVESRFFTSIAVLLMVAPGRISEVLALPVDCIGWEEDSSGEKQMYLRWRAAKGGGATKKWVTTAMHAVVEEAVSRLTSIGAAARTAAKFAYDNPGQFMRHPGCTTSEDFGEDDPLEPLQIAGAIAIKPILRQVGSRLQGRWAELHRAGTVTYRVLADEAARDYKGDHWPYINANKEVLVSDALCLVREFEHHDVFSVRPFSWRLPTTGNVNDRLGGREKSSLFERAGLRNPDRSPITLTTHQLRHWLSTMAVRAGMDDYTLARWAGRARIEDNRHYDHRTEEERNAELREVLAPERMTTLEKYNGGVPVTFKELGIDRPGATKVTMYGMCTNDFSTTPCVKQRKCLACKDHVCIKGAHTTLERIRDHEQRLDQRLDEARKKTTEGVFGADRWFDDGIFELALTRTMRTMMETEDLPHGTILSIPAEYDPSPVRRTLMTLNHIGPAPLEDVPVKVLKPQIEGPKDA